MRRLLFLLPLCCVLAPDGPPRRSDTHTPPAVRACKVHDDGATLPDNAGMEKLARTDPIAFLKNCLKRYDREVKGYQATLRKHERVKGELLPPEVIAVAFLEKPFSVRMDWLQGAGAAQRTLYVAGENGGQLLALPAGRFLSLIGAVKRDPLGPDAMKSSRIPITQFGIRLGSVSTLDAWLKAKKRGDLKVVFQGTRKVKRAGGRSCWVLKRVGYPAPEDDGIDGATFYFDTQTWLQGGSHLTGPKGLIGDYWFTDIELNPDFPADTFTREGISKRK
jgi:hypothetical protein